MDGVFGEEVTPELNLIFRWRNDCVSDIMRMNHELSSGGISTYYADLDAAAKRRYDEKLDMLPGLVDDPYINSLFVAWPETLMARN